MTKAYSIIVAGGSGARMGSDTRKQYLSLGNFPILAHTLRTFDAAASIKQIVLAVPKDDIGFIKNDFVPTLDLYTPIQITTGGNTRQASVYQGLLTVNETNGIVAIHDGVRPFVTPEEIDLCVETAEAYGACIMGIPVSETMKEVHQKSIRKTVDRSNMWLAQTPQTFHYKTIRKAHDMALRDGVDGTDDAMLVERIGVPVRIVQGHRRNIKITTPDDLILANAFLKLGWKNSF